MRSHRVDVAVFAIALAIVGLVALALVWSGDWAYAALAKAAGGTSTTILVPRQPDGSRVEATANIDTWIGWHHAWASYVIGAAANPPIAYGTGPIFTSDEYAHMADVRSVFRGAETVAVLALGIVAFRLTRARGQRRATMLVRDASLAAAGIVSAGFTMLGKRLPATVSLAFGGFTALVAGEAIATRPHPDAVLAIPQGEAIRLVNSTSFGST